MRFEKDGIKVSVSYDGTVYKDGHTYMQFVSEYEAIEYLIDDGWVQY